jgi:hypothetical protein
MSVGKRIGDKKDVIDSWHGVTECGEVVEIAEAVAVGSIVL